MQRTLNRHYLKNITKILGTSCGVFFVTAAIAPTAALAMTPNHGFSLQGSYQTSLQTQDPPDRETPRAPQGTGSRGDCTPAVNRPPLQRVNNTQGIEKTSLGHPMFWIYVPYTSSDAPSAEFSIQDSEDDLYRVQLQLPKQPGFVSVQLPDSIKPLQEGQTYRWYMDINCADGQQAGNSTPTSITGIIQRIAMPSGLQTALDQAQNGIQRAEVYAKQGLLLEAMTELSSLQATQVQRQQITEKIVPVQLAKEAIVGALTTSSQSK